MSKIKAQIERLRNLEATWQERREGYFVENNPMIFGVTADSLEQLYAVYEAAHNVVYKDIAGRTVAASISKEYGALCEAINAVEDE